MIISALRGLVFILIFFLYPVGPVIILRRLRVSGRLYATLNERVAHLVWCLLVSLAWTASVQLTYKHQILAYPL